MVHVFVTDRDLGKQFPARLREAGLLVERHADQFDPATSDEVWMPQLAQWFVQTLPRIEAFLEAHQAPYIVKLQRPTPKDLVANLAAPGRVLLWVPARG